MTDIFDLIPPIFSNNEEPIDDIDFEKRCNDYINDLSSKLDDLIFDQKRITLNEKFGIVCRITFNTPDKSASATNIVLLWLRQNGDLAEFIGFDVPNSGQG